MNTYLNIAHTSGHSIVEAMDETRAQFGYRGYLITFSDEPGATLYIADNMLTFAGRYPTVEAACIEVNRRCSTPRPLSEILHPGE